jgi:DNA mismatch endonuclease (patch repair protein)
MDRITAARRSWNMSRIKGRDTVPEKRVRSLLHRLGFRFSLGRRELPGRPDIVMPGRRIVVFVHGCFWHRHEGCSNSVLPKTRPEFWLAKLNGNVERDERNAAALEKQGWKVLTIWECEIDNEVRLSKRLLKLIPRLRNA